MKYIASCIAFSTVDFSLHTFQKLPIKEKKEKFSHKLQYN
jgi:hypothetical protein